MGSRLLLKALSGLYRYGWLLTENGIVIPDIETLPKGPSNSFAYANYYIGAWAL